MSKIKEKIKSIFGRFPLTFVIGILFTIFLAINIDNDYVPTNVIDNVSIFSVIFAIGTFSIESITRKNMSKKKMLFYILAAQISGVITCLINIDNELVVNYTTRFAIVYSISFMLFSIFALYKISGKEFNEYLTKVMTNIFKSGVIYSLFAIGIAMILAVFCVLILDNEYFDIIARAEILLFGIYFVPRLMYSLVDVEDEVNKFFEVIFKYVLDILLMIAFVVIYLYIGKIIILRDMPVNQLYRIVAALFVIGFPIWTATSFFEDGKILSKINKMLPMAFIPFILLQVYTLGIRIIGNGLTQLRYIAIMLIIFESIYVAIYIKCREKVGICALIVIAMTCISVIIPGVNMYKVSECSQYNILKKYEIGKEYTNEEKLRFRGAYKYLLNLNDGEKIIDKALTQEEKEEIERLNDYNYDNDYYRGNIFIHVSKNVEYIDIFGYNKLYKLSAYNYEDIPLENAFKNVECNNSNMKIDLSDIFIEALNSSNAKEQLENMGVVQIDEHTAVLLEYIYLIYDDESRTVTQYSIEGYLLEK